MNLELDSQQCRMVIVVAMTTERKIHLYTKFIHLVVDILQTGPKSSLVSIALLLAIGSTFLFH